MSLRRPAATTPVRTVPARWPVRHATAAAVGEPVSNDIRRGLEEAGFVSFGFAGGGFARVMSNVPVRNHDDLKGRKVWVPEGDLISYESMQALDLSPVTLPLTDVLTGLQTGLIDIVTMSPAGALVLQWHTKVDYLTHMPIVYSMGLLAIQSRAYERLSQGDQAVVREVMTNLYAKWNEENSRDADEALRDFGVAGRLAPARARDTQAGPLRHVADGVNAVAHPVGTARAGCAMGRACPQH